MVNLTTEIKLGKQAVVYMPEFRMLPDSIKAYRIDVVSIDVYKIWGFVPRQLTNPLEIKLALENLLSNR